MNSVDTDGSSAGSDGNTSGVRTCIAILFLDLDHKQLFTYNIFLFKMILQN